MFRTLRNRLILSHLLPTMIIIPLMGVVLIYALETQFLLPSISREMVGDAKLLIELTRQQDNVWGNASLAQDLVNQIQLNPGKRIMLLAPDGRLLASTDPNDSNQLGKVLQFNGLETAQKGLWVSKIVPSLRLQGDIIDVLAPVTDNNKKLVGIVRVSYRYATVTEELIQFRYLIGGILLVSLLSVSLLGLVLAVNIDNPIRQVTRTIHDLARGNRQEQIPEHGPEEMRQLLHAVNHLVERLHGLEEARKQLLANLIHELGRPLGAIRMAIHASLTGAEEDPQLLKELLVGMDEQAATLQRLVEDLTQLHGQVLGTLELDRKSVGLSDWLSKTLRPWQEMARQKGLTWEVNLPPELPTILADPLRLSQVIGNLTSNAIKYTPKGGKVCVSAGETQEAVWIRVSDTGPGIPPEEQELIFKPFYRGNQGRRIKQGMGLGLSIARDLVTAHEGRIDIESKPGQGTHFIVWLPIDGNSSSPTKVLGGHGTSTSS